jgi:spore coat polysaccharide biosynthesis protein SpsF
VKDARDRSAMRWVVDEPVDFEFVSRVYDALYDDDPYFDRDAIYALLNRDPSIAAINAGIDPEAGWRRSLSEDRSARTGIEQAAKFAEKPR